MFRLPTLVDAPFVVSESLFVNPKYRGRRVGAPETIDPTETREVFLRKPIRVHDGRSLRRAPSLEREGFRLLQAPIRLDFRNGELVTTRFYDYCTAAVEAATGCLAARVMQHEFRDGTTSPPSEGGTYAAKAHADVCSYVEDVMDVPDGRHYGLFTVWRSIDADREIEVMPLALCDATSVAAADIVYTDGWRRTEPRTRLVNCGLIHDVAQSWYYFPRMTPDEALLFRQYDTRRADAGMRTTFHTSFKDPTTREGAPLRRTVEARVLAIFPEADPERELRKARFQAEVPKTRRDGTVSAWRHERMLDWDVR